MSFLITALVIAVGLNVLLFIPAFFYKTDKLTDLSYALTFGVVAVGGYALSAQTTAHTVALLLVLAWALRLGTFLVIRIQKVGRDHRFDEMRSHFWPFFKFWLTQGLAVWVILLPAISFFQQDDPMVKTLSFVGVFVFLTGLAIEATADAQKFAFSNSKAKGSWIDTGIWRMSRHPNYLGEISVWTGMYLFAYSTLPENARIYGLASPLFIATLLLFVSGIPILEKAADKKWGNQKAYQTYKKEVPVLLPTPRSIARLFSR